MHNTSLLETVKVTHFIALKVNKKSSILDYWCLAMIKLVVKLLFCRPYIHLQDYRSTVIPAKEGIQ